jgi:RNA polymerase sigma-70 factor (ECF subfamily)
VAEYRPPNIGNAACAALALQHADALYNLALAYTRNPADAQDLVQETYLRAQRFWYRFVPGTNLRAWLFTILRHTFINAYRKEARQQARAALADLPLPQPHHAFPPRWQDPGTVDALLRHVVQDEVKRALDALPEAYRRIVILADMAECSYKDIATIVGCPVGTVMSRLCRGRQRLRQSLATFARQSGYLRPPRPRSPYTLGLSPPTCGSPPAGQPCVEEHAAHGDAHTLSPHMTERTCVA